MDNLRVSKVRVRLGRVLYPYEPLVNAKLLVFRIAYRLVYFNELPLPVRSSKSSIKCLVKSAEV